MATLPSILILEDDYLTARFIAEAVADAGYRALGPVSSAESAQKLINEKGIDAALLDARLGADARSFDLAARLQAMRVPFAFITGYSPALLPSAFRQTPWLMKPASRESLVKLLHRLVPLPSGES